MQKTNPHIQGLAVVAVVMLTSSGLIRAAETPVLCSADYRHYVDKFNAADVETYPQLIPNVQAWDWLEANIPWFDCPSVDLEEIYYFRWWSYRKHVRRGDQGRVITEFLAPVRHAGKFNTISCALGHQIAEGRWLRDQGLIDEYADFWFRGADGGRMPHFHKYSSWVAAALLDRCLVTNDRVRLIARLDDLVEDFRRWQSERAREDGLFWQFDVRDGMEESISGGRDVKNIRPTINSYMIANARAIQRIAAWAGRHELSEEFGALADELHAKMIDRLWDPQAQFFKVCREDGSLSDAREAIGYVPWMFGLARPEHAAAWQQINDNGGFHAPFGLTTAEQRHPQFRTRGTGTCEWDGAVWPFATSQTLTGLVKYLHGTPATSITRRDFFAQLLTYARAHQRDGIAYLGEYYDGATGNWLIEGPKAERSRNYNHSTFNDLVISGLVGIVPREDEILEVDPLLPTDAWNWFCLDRLPYHGHLVTVIWDRTGERYHRGKGLTVWVDDVKVAQAMELTRVTGKLPTPATAATPVPAAAGGLAAPASRLSCEVHAADRVRIAVDDSPVAVYVYRDEQIPRPYFTDLRAPDGVEVTRHYPPRPHVDLSDHPTFHPGLWMTFGDISGSDYWRLKARTEHVRFLVPPEADANRVRFRVLNRYLQQDDPANVVCCESCEIQYWIRPEGYLFLWDSTFYSDHEFSFGDQEEMGLGFRVATRLRAERVSGKEPHVPSGTGSIIDAAGRRNEQGVWGQSSAWCDYSGTLEGERVGMTLICHPDNFRGSWFHARDRGYLVANPFGRAAFHQGKPSRVVVAAGETLRLRYGVLIHSGPLGTQPDLEAASADYQRLALAIAAVSTRSQAKS